MKAYVIKNKEGKYFGYYDSENNRYEFSKKPKRFIMFNTLRDANKIKNLWKMNKCEPVEITIIEGDLEQENKQLKALLDAKEKIETNSIKGFKKLKNENKQLKERIQNILDGKEIPAICAKKYREYEEQLQEQIDYKDEYYHYWQETKRELRNNKQIRHQVCDEIKEKLKAHCDYTNDIGRYIPEEKIDIIFLDKIEKENNNEQENRTST